jgi:hypothetical protein
METDQSFFLRFVYVLFGISPRIWNGLRTYTEVPLYILGYNIMDEVFMNVLISGTRDMKSEAYRTLNGLK